MLALISLDSVSRPLFEKMIAQGALPHCAALLARGHTATIQGTPLHGSVYRSLYSGYGVSTHGGHYAVEWNASEQCVRPAPPMNPADLIFSRLDSAGKRLLVIDPPECGQFSLQHGVAFSGWQCTVRFVLPRWYASKDLGRTLERQFGAPQTCHEVFGRPSPPRLRAMQRVLMTAPRRLADGAIEALRQGPFDLMWVSFASAHIAGHQLWRSTLESDHDSVNPEEPRLLTEVYREVDQAVGRIVAALPSGASILLFSPKGMGPDTSRADLLPAMLSKILNEGKTESAQETRRWNFRSAIPVRLRAAVADVIPDNLAMKIAARLESGGAAKWTGSPAFALPSDGSGFIRLNLRGREREGIVDPAGAEALLDRISQGLRTFTEPSGQPCVASILRPSDIDAPGPKSSALPDLIVVWNATPSAGLRKVSSPRFGEVLRTDVGSGRSGNHGGDAWISIIPGSNQPTPPAHSPVRLTDLAATACAYLQLPHADLPGRPLLAN